MGRRRGVAGSAALPVVLVALFASFAIAASSAVGNWARRPDEPAGRLAELGAKLALNDFSERVVSDEIEADDEQFLRHLKLAAQFLDDKLARAQQPPAAVELASSGDEASGAADVLLADHEQAAGQPRYKLLADDLAALGALNGRAAAATRPRVAYAVARSGADDDEQHDDNQQAPQQATNQRDELLKYLLLLDNAHEADEARAPQTLAAPLGDTSDAQQQRKREDVKLTTLLEDEDQERAASGSGSGVSYGKLVRRQDEAEAAPAPAASLFGRLYANVSHYLPFLNQISILRRPQAQEEAAERRVASDLPTLAPGQGEAKRAPARQSDAGRPIELEATAPAFAALHSAKQAVSAIKATGEGREADKIGGGGGVGGGNHLRARLNASDEGAAAAAAASKRLDQDESRDEEREHDHELDQMIASEQRGQPMSGQFSLMRQSNLVVPLHEGDARAQDSLLGKYIYAPTQHYYLNGASGPAAAAAASSMRGAHEAAASYEQLRSAYAFQKEPGLLNFASLLGPGQPATAAAAAGGAPKSNDLYFLVMVGAFCVMAMAVVLAAGLFAYRVQQQRKSSQAPEYPTYGVVGPNNMGGGGAGGVGQALNGKCGNAAAFMGGYFNHAHAGALGGAPGKPAGKQPPAADLYAAAAAAAAAANIDSGLDKSSSSLVSNASSLKKGSSSTISSGGAANANCVNASGAAGAACGQPGNQDAARMYHYQHQKQQMIISDRSSAGRHTSASDLDSDEEQDDEGSYTVYECPGLASAHEMEIKNPLFHDDQSP